MGCGLEKIALFCLRSRGDFDEESEPVTKTDIQEGVLLWIL